jgi:DNA-binding XRE family transcriptional regulator
MTKRSKGPDPNTDLPGYLRGFRERMADALGVEVYHQHEAAADNGLSVHTWGNWEQGRRKPSPLAIPTLVAKLEAALETAKLKTALKGMRPGAKSKKGARSVQTV